MHSITICERNSNFDNKDLCELIRRSHTVNKAKGLFYGTANITEETLQSKFDNGMTCFVVLEDSELVGMGCVSIINVKRWYAHNKKTAYLELVAVDPRKQGRGIGKIIRDRCILYAQEKEMDTCLSVSAELNEPIRKLYEDGGFKRVGYGAGKTNNFYSVFYMKWINGCPFSDTYVRIRFTLDKLIHRFVFLPGGKLRFGRH